MLTTIELKERNKMALKKEKSIVEEKVVEQPIVGKSETDILREENKNLQEQMKKQMELMSQLMANQSSNTSPPSAKDEVTRMVKIVHLSAPTGGLVTPVSLSNRNFDLRIYGEEKFLRFDEFQELASKYKSWFDENILALTEEDYDLVERFDLICNKDIALTSYHLKNIASLSVEDLETLVNKLSLNHKLLITRTWAHGYYEDVDSAFKDRRKVEILNEIVNGAMENILAELDAQRRKK